MAKDTHRHDWSGAARLRQGEAKICAAMAESGLATRRRETQRRSGAKKCVALISKGRAKRSIYLKRNERDWQGIA